MVLKLVKGALQINAMRRSENRTEINVRQLQLNKQE